MVNFLTLVVPGICFLPNQIYFNPILELLNRKDLKLKSDQMGARSKDMLKEQGIKKIGEVTLRRFTRG
jgi:hypothetical protein